MLTRGTCARSFASAAIALLALTYHTQRIWIVRADGTWLHAITAARPAFWTGSPSWKPVAG
jgi:hypothetical protein